MIAVYNVLYSANYDPLQAWKFCLRNLKIIGAVNCFRTNYESQQKKWSNLVILKKKKKIFCVIDQNCISAYFSSRIWIVLEVKHVHLSFWVKTCTIISKIQHRIR